MNFLFHMLLSGSDEEVLVGNFMGDFVKGRLAGRFPHGIIRGLDLHRRIDSYSGRDPFFRQSRDRIDPRYGHYRSVMVDLFYDHLLLHQWGTWSEEPFDRFLSRTEDIITSHREILPDRLQQLLPYIFTELLPSYGEVSGIGRALARMSQRLKRENPLAGSEAELVLHYDGLHCDSMAFMPGIRSFSRAQIEKD